MAHTIYRVIYLIVLMAVLTPLLIYPAEWEEERLPVAVLIALHVREFAATTHALWHTGRRWHRRWKRRRQDQRAKVHLSPSWRAWIAQLLPDAEPLPWAEQAAFEALKRSVEGLFHLLPEATCAALFHRVSWLGGVRCPYCGLSEVSVKDPQYRKYWHRYTCPPCSRKGGREVTFTDLHGTIMEGSHLDVRYWLWAWWLWVTGESIRSIHKELRVNRKTAERMVRLFQLSYFTLRFRLLLGGPVEIDEAYLIAGHKGQAGGLPLKRPPRRRGLKKVGRGTAQTDKVPVWGWWTGREQSTSFPCRMYSGRLSSPSSSGWWRGGRRCIPMSMTSTAFCSAWATATRQSSMGGRSTPGVKCMSTPWKRCGICCGRTWLFTTGSLRSTCHCTWPGSSFGITGVRRLAGVSVWTCCTWVCEPRVATCGR